MGVGGIDTGVVHLNDRHDLTAFDCGVTALDRWLVERALRNERNWASRTYVAEHDGRVVGYYALSASHVDHDEVGGSVRRNMPDPVAAILLGRLAVDQSMHGHGWGGGLLRDTLGRCVTVARAVDARAVITEAISDDARRFYTRFGFRETRNQPMKLYLDMRAVGASR